MSFFSEGYSNPNSLPPSNLNSVDRSEYANGQSVRRDHDSENERARKEAEAKLAAKIAAFSPEERAAYYRKRQLVIATTVIVVGAWILSYYGLLLTVLYVLLGVGLAGWLISIGKGRWVAFALLLASVVIGGRWMWWINGGKSANQQEVRHLVQQQRELDARTARMNLDAKRVSDSLGLIYAAKKESTTR